MLRYLNHLGNRWSEERREKDRESERKRDKAREREKCELNFLIM